MESGSIKTCRFQICSPKFAGVEFGPTQVRLPQVGSAHANTLESGVEEIGASQVDAIQVGVSHQILGAAQIWCNVGVRSAPLIPGFDARSRISTCFEFANVKSPPFESQRLRNLRYKWLDFPAATTGKNDKMRINK
jgi:hypothetical protein